MGYQLNNELMLSEIADELNIEHFGLDVLIKAVGPADLAKSGDLTYSKLAIVDRDGLAIVLPKNGNEIDGSYNGFLLSENPRLDFIRALAFLQTRIGFSTWNKPAEIHPTVIIGQNVVIEDGCYVGENTIIEHNVVLHTGTRIGKNSRIRSCSSIGGDGFGFERLKDGTPLRFPHLGGVVIGNNVELGALNSVARGTLSDTIISSNVKTDNLVHIAHNCHIKDSVIITACAELSGGVTLGKGVWVGPNVSIMQKVTVGDGAFIGLGAVVTKNIPPFSVYAGNPAKKIRDL
jgi:UDP-3-O-[3-hydroxymyristoyl] glucosamine N-acyltransferase